jgi:hypothetical protein
MPYICKCHGFVNFSASRSADAWKKWKEELNLYIDLTMDDDNEPAKVKLFFYLIGTRGREIYETMLLRLPVLLRCVSSFVFDSMNFQTGS